MSLIPIPSFLDLTLSPGDPPNSAYGIWRPHGFDKQLGALDYLKNELVKRTAHEEVRIGKRGGLNYSA